MRWRGEQLHHTGPLAHSLTHLLTCSQPSYIAVASLHSSLLTSHSPHSAQVSSVQSRSSMKPGVKDIKAMERQKKELQAQLAGVRNKTQQLNKIIASKGKDPASSLHRTARPMEATALVVANKTLNDLRPIQRKHRVDKIAASAKARPRDINDIEPMTFPLDGDLKRIQNQHIQRTKCKVAVEKLQKANAQKIEKKKQLGAMNHTHAPVAASMFPNRYVRGELPCTIEHGTKGQYLSWVCPLENLDYDYYLPIFFDGLQCDKEPVVFLATQGIEDMLYACQGDSSRVIPSLKNLVRPLRNALSKFNVKVLLNVLKVLYKKTFSDVQGTLYDYI